MTQPDDTLPGPATPAVNETSDLREVPLSAAAQPRSRASAHPTSEDFGAGHTALHHLLTPYEEELS